MTQNRLSGTKVAVLATADVDQSQLHEARTRLESAGASVVSIPTELPFDRAHPSNVGGLVLLERSATAEDPANAQVVQVVREFMLADKPVAAIGRGIALLIAADAIAGRSVAAPDGLENDVRKAGGILAGTAIIADDKLITARSSSELHVFLERVVRTFAGQAEERHIDQVSEQSFPASDPPPGPGAIGADRGEREPERDAGPDVTF